ncbi:MAG: NAD(P)/FAD-dependent oxidoreductase [Solobacterium sp.]|nr:NAD(P)/FAD-dependent oxidoreductase [Solobacterium sp.]
MRSYILCRCGHSGGLVGAEAALEFGKQGKDVTIIEMLPGIVMQDEPLSQISLMKHLAAENVVCLTNSTVRAIKDDVVEYTDKDGNLQKIAYDTVISATGLRSDTEAAEQFRGTAAKVFTIGDANKAGKIFQCFHNAWHAVRNI